MRKLSSYILYVALVAVSNVNVSDEPIMSSEFTLTWMDISMSSQKFSHYTVFYLPLSGPYGPIMANNRRKRQSAQAGELTMNFTGSNGTLSNLHGAVTYRIQVAAVTKFNGQDIIGDRSSAINMTTLVGSKQVFTATHFVLILCYFSTYCSPRPELY